MDLSHLTPTYTPRASLQAEGRFTVHATRHCLLKEDRSGLSTKTASTNQNVIIVVIVVVVVVVVCACVRVCVRACVCV